MPLRVDKTAVIKLATNTAPTKLRKLIDIKNHYLAELQAARLIDLQHVPSGDNVADALNKPMGPTRTADVKRIFIICDHEDESTDTPTADAPA